MARPQSPGCAFKERDFYHGHAAVAKRSRAARRGAGDSLLVYAWPMNLRVAAAQMCSTEDVAQNLRLARDLVREAADAGAALVGLPENFAYLGSDRDHKLSLAESLDGPGDGPVLSQMRSLAWEARVWLLLGGFPEKVHDAPGKLGNTSVLLDPEGGIRARYRKMHLFDVEIPGGHEFRESDTVA
jgi:predicted amidohydrolase